MAIASPDIRVDTIAEYLGDEADFLLKHRCETIPREDLALPGPDFVERVWLDSDRNPQVIRSLQQIYDSGRLGGSGYVSILPVDQGIEHSAGASFAPNPAYFDPAKIIELALEGGCNAVASTFGVLGMTARRYAHRIPYIVKVNHNELVTIPIRTSRSCSAPSSRPGIWARSLSARPCISARPIPTGRWSK